MKSIGLKLWSGMMLLVVIVLILLWLFQIVFLENFYLSMRISEIKKEGTQIAKSINVVGRPEFQNMLDAFSFNNNLSFELLDLNGSTSFTSGVTGANGQMPMMRNTSRLETFDQVIKGKEITLSMTHPRFGNKFLLIGFPYILKDQVEGAFLITMPIASVEDTTFILKKQLIIITFILLIAAIIISFIISKSFTKPILKIKQVSEKMASGDFTVRISTTNKDEIGKLADTINHLGQELSKIDELRKDLIANVSHELRTPLSIIRGYAETIRDVSGNNPEKREKQLDIIVEESERLSKIVDDILNLSQLQAGNINLAKKQFLINNTIENVIKRYDILSEKTEIKITTLLSNDVLICADESRLEQVLYNLINNAFNHTKAGGKITVKAIDNVGIVRIEITDTGVGISSEDLVHVWDRYYKSEKTEERKMVGTGLGLAIVKSVLEAHSANFGVESKEGIGTTFWFEITK